MTKAPQHQTCSGSCRRCDLFPGEFEACPVVRAVPVEDRATLLRQIRRFSKEAELADGIGKAWNLEPLTC